MTRQQLIDSMEQAKPLVKEREGMFKKYNFFIFWRNMGEQSFANRASFGFFFITIPLFFIPSIIVGSFVLRYAPQLAIGLLAYWLLFSLIFGQFMALIFPMIANAQIGKMNLLDEQNSWCREVTRRLPGIHYVCCTEKRLNKLIDYVKKGHANSVEEASNMYVEKRNRRLFWLMRRFGC